MDNNEVIPVEAELEAPKEELRYMELDEDGLVKNVVVCDDAEFAEKMGWELCPHPDVNIGDMRDMQSGDMVSMEPERTSPPLSIEERLSLIEARLDAAKL